MLENEILAYGRPLHMEVFILLAWLSQSDGVLLRSYL